jgi:hypothetical protein
VPINCLGEVQASSRCDPIKHGFDTQEVTWVVIVNDAPDRMVPADPDAVVVVGPSTTVSVQVADVPTSPEVQSLPE